MVVRLKEIFTSNAICCGDIAAVLPIRSNITRKKNKKIEIDNIATVPAQNRSNIV